MSLVCRPRGVTADVRQISRGVHKLGTILEQIHDRVRLLSKVEQTKQKTIPDRLRNITRSIAFGIPKNDAC